MNEQFFFTPPENIHGSELYLRGKEAHHAGTVLRKARGDRVWVVDGTGTGYHVELSKFSKTCIRADILSTRRMMGETVCDITLASALVRRERFEWIIEKSVELGVRRLIPMKTSRCVMKVEKKPSRWDRIAEAAMKQCGRSMLMRIDEPKNMKNILTLGTGKHRLIAAFGGRPVERSLGPDTGGSQGAVLVVGPEGGFSPEELREAEAQRFQPVSMGERRLRTETAAVALTSMVMYCFGEM